MNTNLGQDLTKAGSDFGSLILGIGNAVAATQQKLTETSADTTSVLAQTLVDVIAVQETIYDDAGTVTGSQSFTQKLPLVNFVDPVFYQYPQVRIQARFAISEVATSTSSTSSSSSQSGSIGLGFSGNPFSFGVSGSGSSSSQSTSVATQSDLASAIGQVRMFARIEPQPGLGVPNPVQVIVGPSLSLVEGEIKDAVDGTTPIRTMSVLIQLRNKDGQPISGKAISIETDGTPWSFTPSGASTTGADGNVSILLKRSFPPPPTGAPPLDTSPQPVSVSCRLGLVANGLTITF